MKTLKALKEERVALLSRAKAIADLAQTENRELSTEETGEVDRILGRGTKGDANYLAGEIDKCDEAIARAEKIEARSKELALRAADRQIIEAQPNVRTVLDMQRHGPLKGFDSKQAAYNAGAWFAAQFLGNPKCTQHCRDQGITVYDAMSGGTNTAGGYLVPEEMESAVIRHVEEYGVFRRNCRNITMTSDTLNFARRTAGVTAYYVAEVPSSITESSPTVGLAQLVAKVLAVRTLVSVDLADDSIVDLGNWIATEIGTAIANAEDSAGFLGDGSSTYGGIQGLKTILGTSTYSASKYTAITGNTAFSTLDAEDFEAMVGKLPMWALNGAKWYISQAGFWNSMARLQVAAGGNTTADFGRGPTLQFMGFPVEISQVMNSTTGAQTSTDGLVYFGNLGMGATMGTRRGITTQVLRELYAGTRQIGFIAFQRFDINYHERGDTTTAGAVVMLSTPGS